MSLVSRAKSHFSGLVRGLPNVPNNKYTSWGFPKKYRGRPMKVPEYSPKRSHSSHSRKSIDAPKSETGQSSISRESGITTRAPAAELVKYKKTVHFKQPKAVHPTKKFKELVQAALTTDVKNLHGIYHTVSMNYLTQTGTPNTQSVGSSFAGATLTGATDEYSQWCFLPEVFLDAASVLFGNKSGQSGVKGLYRASPNGASAANNIGYGLTPNGGGTFRTDTNTATFTVKRSWEKYTLKNNTQRTMMIDIYLCKPKRESSTQTTNSAELGSSSPATLPDALVDPISYWAQALVDDIKNYINVAQVTQNQLFLKPTMNKEFNKAFECEETKIVLEPGQTYQYHVQGPAGLDIDMSTYFSNQIYQNIQKFCRYPMFVSYPDIEGTFTSGTYGGLRENDNAISTAGTAVYVERQMFFDIKMPEEAGFNVNTTTLTTGGSGQSLGYRRPAYFMANWGATSATPNAQHVRVDEQNPISIEVA